MNWLYWLVQLLLNGAVVFAVAKLIPGVRVAGFFSSVMVALVYGLLNLVLRDLLVLLSFPVILLSFGLFLLVLNGFLLWLTDKILGSFEIRSFFALILATLGISFGAVVVDRVLMPAIF